MHLINVKTFKLEEFIDETVVEYAILSHRWGAEEISFQDIQSSKAPSSSKGFQKIKFSCEQAQEHGWEYVWVDTCCINKESTAELSESINSMYRWYQSAAVCYTFFEDLSLDPDNTEAVESRMKRCEWFERGWALQELIAPKKMLFYDRSWRHVGTKGSLCNVIYDRTGIPTDVLLDARPNLNKYSIAQRMSWASQRITTRPEDIAYCLLGIFDVNMPMLYGEGKRAFLRLQEELIKQVDDHSIFAWSVQQDRGDVGRVSGLLSDSPSAFKDCGNVVAKPWANSKPFSITNRGLNISLRAIPCTTDMYIGALNAVRLKDPVHHHATTRIGIFLQRQEEQDQYGRVVCNGVSVIALPNSFPDKHVLRDLKGTDFWFVPFYVRQRQHPERKRRCANGFRLTLIDGGAVGRGSATRLITFKPPYEGPTTGTIGVGTGWHHFRRLKLELDAELNAILFIHFWKVGSPIWSIKGMLKVGDPGGGWPEGKSPELTCTWTKVTTPGEATKLMAGKSGTWAIKADPGRDLRFNLMCGSEFHLYRTSTNDGGVIWALDIRLTPVNKEYNLKETFLSGFVPEEDMKGFKYTPPRTTQKPKKTVTTAKVEREEDGGWVTSEEELQVKKTESQRNNDELEWEDSGEEV